MKRQYVISERAHFMCPNMHFGICMEINKEYDKTKIEKVINDISDAHPFLKAVIAEETEKLYYRITEKSQIEVLIGESEHMWDDYYSITKTTWDVYTQGLLKIRIYPMENGVKILFVAHHLLTDGRGLLELAKEFADDYVDDKSPENAEEQLIESIEDLPAGSKLSGISKILVRQCNRQWKKENAKVDYNYYRNRYFEQSNESVW